MENPLNYTKLGPNRPKSLHFKNKLHFKEARILSFAPNSFVFGAKLGQVAILGQNRSFLDISKVDPKVGPKIVLYDRIVILPEKIRFWA